MRPVELLQTPLTEKLGLPRGLGLGYLGLLLFMIGDGVEAGFLAPYLLGMHFSQQNVALVFAAYGFTAAIASWLSGPLSDLLGPKKVMWIGFIIWIVFEIPFLVYGLGKQNYTSILVSYTLRGFGYPLFAFGFLVWITAVAPRATLSTAVGWFWSARTGGLPTLGSLLASFSVPLAGSYKTLWMSLALVAVGGLIALFGTDEKSGTHRLVRSDERPVQVLLSGVSIIWRKPKVGLGGIVATITTTSEFGFLVFLPSYFMDTIGFTLSQWLRLLSIIFATNVGFNLIWGFVGDKFGWQKTVAFVGGCGCAIATLALYYVPHTLGNNYPLVVIAGMAYGAALAGFVPLSAIMSWLAPDHRGAAMSIMNLGSGLSIWLGPAIVGVFLSQIGVAGIMWIFAILNLLAAVITFFLKLPEPQLAQTVN